VTSRRLAALLTATIALALPVTASAAVGIGHSGWYWGNPLPQGNTLRAVELNGARGYAAGDFGTLLRTEDGGATWTGIATGLTADLNRVGVIDSDSLVVGGGCTLRRSDDAGASFRRLPFSASEARCSAPLAAFAFPSDSVGYLVLGDGTVLRTGDGGKTFARRTAVPGTSSAGGPAKPTDITFTAPDTGVAITGGSDGRVYRTTDGGGSWTLAASVAQGLTGLRFTDAVNGFAVGAANTLLRTADGGASWSPRPLAGAPSSSLTGIRCTGSSTCLIATAEGTRLLRTTDAGDTAASVSPSTSKIFAAALGSPTRAVAVGEGGATVVSDTAGMTFATIGESIPGPFRRLRAVSATTAYAAGADGRAARTTDGGASWTPFAVSTADDVVDLSFPTLATGFAIDSSGTALRTENAGASWLILNTGANIRPSALLALDAKRVLLVGPRGLRRSTTGGASFAAVRSRPVRRAQLAEFDRAGSAVLVFGEKVLAISRNGGAGWRRMRLPRGKRRLFDADFSSPRSGYVIMGRGSCNGRLYVTRTGGRRWREITTTGTSDFCLATFGDARNGWLRADIDDPAGGGVLRTSDGGKSWHPQLLTRNGVADVVAAGRSSAFALIDSSLFATATGGDQGSASTLTLRASKRRVRRRGLVKVGGRLRPPEGGERVVVAMRAGGRWTRKAVLVAANGTFTTTWRLRRSALFVAQWRGDDDRSGTGTGAVKVSVRRR
jgi:photosystem II stability/assembly factor-like uncharacterized protein